MDLTTKTALENSETNLSNSTRDIFNYNYLYTYLHWTKHLNDFDLLYKKYAHDFTNKDFPLEIEKIRKTLKMKNFYLVANRNDELHDAPQKSLNAKMILSPIFICQILMGITSPQIFLKTKFCI